MSIVNIYIPVCDRCGDSDPLNGCESESEMRKVMDRQGWGEGMEGDICPDCQEEPEDEEDDEDEEDA